MEYHSYCLHLHIAGLISVANSEEKVELSFYIPASFNKHKALCTFHEEV